MRISDWSSDVCSSDLVVGFSGDRLFLMPVGDVQGVTPNSRVIPRPGHSRIAVGDALLGRVIDAGGNPLDGRGPLRCDAYIALSGAPINPMERHPIDRKSTRLNSRH